MRTYSELISLPTFEERYYYLKLFGKVGEETFGYDRWLNQEFYRWPEWRKLRKEVIARDGGCDLASKDREIPDGVLIIIHHMNPITVDDIKRRNPRVLDPENLITTIDSTHKAIHYGDESLLMLSKPVERVPFDTCPWR